MTDQTIGAARPHDHTFLGEAHAASERKTWIVIWVCAAMMVVEIGGGWLFGSIALVADGLHMSTHAGAMLLAALAYTFARRHASDSRFSFGAGKFGDLAGFTSAIILAMIALLIAWEALSRLVAPQPINYAEAIAIACLGFAVNVFTAWILTSRGHDHGHGHSHGHAHHGHDDEEPRLIQTASGDLILEIHEDGAPPRFRLSAEDGQPMRFGSATIATLRADGARQAFEFKNRGAYWESVEEIPEPHEFAAEVTIDGEGHSLAFEEHEHADAAAGRDNNMRAAIVHIVADAAVSILVIAGLVLARAFGWLWIDPMVGIVGAIVIASWAIGLIRDTGGILLDMVPDAAMASKLRAAIETDGDRVVDLHLWRLGPGHLGAIVSIVAAGGRDTAYYRKRLARFRALSHLTIELRRPA